MHDINDPRNQLASAATENKECIGCQRVLATVFFRRDASYRDGRKDLCTQCEDSPRLSTEEHVYRLRELNANSMALKSQRREHQSDYEDDAPRVGREMPHSEFLLKLQKLVPRLFFTDGRIVGDIAVFLTYGQPQPHLDGKTFEYLWYIPTGILPEYSQYEFDERGILTREKKRGWRTPLLRLIKRGLLTEEVCRRTFGEAVGPASTVWHRELKRFRTNTAVD